MLYCWLSPSTLLSLSRRESYLQIVDALGKWSLIDFYVMMLMLCAFYLQLYILASKIHVDVSVKPNWGFYGFLLATMMSLGLGHLVLACHRLVTEPKAPSGEREREIEGERESVGEREREKESVSLSSMTFLLSLSPSSSDSSYTSLSSSEETERERERETEREDEREREKVNMLSIHLTSFGSLLLFFFLSLTVLFTIAGTFLKTMEFDFKGLVGLMLKGDDIASYSYVSIGGTIPEHSGMPNDFGVRWLQASFYLFGLAMPLGYLAVTYVLWFVPLSLSRLRQLHVLSEGMSTFYI